MSAKMSAVGHLLLSVTLLLAIGHFSFVSLAAAVTPRSLASSVSLLFSNNLNHTDDSNHSSFLLLHSHFTTTQHAHDACARFSETLVTVEEAKGNSTDLSDLLSYHVFRGDIVPSHQPILLADGMISYSVQRGHVQFHDVPTEKNSISAPCLCTQSDRQTLASQSNATLQNAVSVTDVATGNTFNGYRNLKSFRFLGIPYSTGPARWEYANVNESKDKVYNATSFSPPCTQTGVNRSSEDCLYLNIWTPYLPHPTHPRRRLRPVLFYIHGGGFTAGEGSDPLGEGANIVSRGDVVMVFPNYRLSNLGFMNIPGTDIKGNYGLADQMVALEWTRRNIEAFGGDPNHIVIHGQSAGAASVQAMLTSPVVKGKFVGGMMSSVPGGHYLSEYSRYLSPKVAYKISANRTIHDLGCANDDKAKVVRCLKALPAQELVSKNFERVANDSEARYIIQDGHYITTEHLQVTHPKQVASVPIMIGFTAEDGAPFLDFNPADNTRKEAINAIVGPGNATVSSYGPAILAEKKLFPFPSSSSNSTLNAFTLTAQIGTDLAFRCAAQSTASISSSHHTFPRVYAYEFQRTYQVYFRVPHGICDFPLGTLRCHGGDLAYYFGSLDQFGLPYRDAKDVYFGRMIMDHWTSFVRHLNPNPEPGYLEARGRPYASTAKVLARNGRWKHVNVKGGGQSIRLLDWPPSQSDFIRKGQCQVEGIPISTYWQ